MSDYCRRLTEDTSGAVSTPVAFERVQPSQLSTGDRILLRPGEPAPVTGELIVSLTVDTESPEKTETCLVETEAGGRDSRRPGDTIEQDEIISDSSVVVEVEGGVTPGWPLGGIGTVGGWLWAQKVRLAVSVIVLVLAFIGTGLGGYNPVETIVQETGAAETIAAVGGDATAQQPSEAPRVTVAPPTTARAESTSTAAPPVGASLTVTASDPPLLRSNEGAVGVINGTIGGSLNWSTDRVDSVVIVVQVWVPDDGWVEVSIPDTGWVEISRVRITPTASDVTVAPPLDLGAIVGNVAYANETRADAFENPDPGTVRTTRGKVAVTAVLFDGSTEVARVQTTDEFAVSVRNIDLNIELGQNTSNANGSDASVSLASAEDVDPGTEWTNRGTLSNTGSVPGKIELTNVTITSYENGLTEPEAKVDDTGGNPGEGAGELHASLMVRIVVIDSNGTRTYPYGNETTYRPLQSLTNASVPIATLNGGESATLVVEYRVAPDAGNEVQSDYVTIDFGFTVVEISSQNRSAAVRSHRLG